jgi:SNF2 family DNA or RNA helicase
MAKLILQEDKMALRSRFEDKEIARSIPGREWDPPTKSWMYPVRAEILNELTQKFPGLEVSPNVLQAVTAVIIREQAAAIIKQAGWSAATPDEPMPIKSTPFKHQILGYNIGLKLPSSAILMEQGCGKSLTAIAIMGRRFCNSQVKRVLIVAPASVVPTWAAEGFGELAIHADFPYDCLALQGPVVKRTAALTSWNALQIAFINYESVWRMEEALTWWKPDMIICDESQRIKTSSTRQSKSLHKLGKLAKYRLILTGTPVTQGPLDFFSQYKFLDPSVFGSSHVAFRSRYAILGGPNRQIVVGYKNLPDLVERVHKIAFRVTKAEALDLPEWTDQLRFCTLEPFARQFYISLARDSVAELESGEKVTAANILVKLLKLQEATGGFIKEDGIKCVSKAKLNLLAEIMDDLISAGKKVVIFARFRAEIAAIMELLEKQNTEYTAIYGDIPLNDRGARVNMFQQDPRCKVFLAQIQTAGLGITLTAADTAIFYSLDFSFANYDQCKARIHRIGQKNACTYIHLLAEETIDTKVIKVLQGKKSMADAVVDNWKDLF